MEGSHWSAIPPFIFEPAIKISIQDSTTVQGISPPYHVLIYDRGAALYIYFHLKYVMLLGQEGIWDTECYFGPDQRFCGDESQKDHDQAG